MPFRAIPVIHPVTTPATAIALIPAGIQGVATVAGTVVETASIAPGTGVNGAATVTSTVVEIAVLVPAAVNGAATVTGTVVEVATLDAAINGTATVIGAVVALEVFVAAVTGTATVTSVLADSTIPRIYNWGAFRDIRGAWPEWDPSRVPPKVTRG